MSAEGTGRFIVIEGIDGAGTTTQTRKLVGRLRSYGYSALATFEPSEGPIGTMIRQMLHRRIVSPVGEDRFRPIDADTLTLLFSADRIDHIGSVIEPALKEGRTVVCDRYDNSTIAYQGVEGDIAWVKQANSKARRPDLTIYLRVPVDTALSRLGNRGDLSIFEKTAFLEKVSEIYEREIGNDPKAVILDGNLSVNEVGSLIWENVRSLFEEN